MGWRQILLLGRWRYKRQSLLTARARRMDPLHSAQGALAVGPPQLWRQPWECAAMILIGCSTREYTSHNWDMLAPQREVGVHTVYSS